MEIKRMGRQTVRLPNMPSIISCANVVGKQEGKGPLREYYDDISEDSLFGEKTWEKAESEMQKRALNAAIAKAGIGTAALSYIFAGDLLNQCIGTSFALRPSEIPFYGLYGACSTMAESLSLAAMMVDGGFANWVAAMTSSHFCTAERQYRNPLEYGNQRTPTAQWTATAAGAVILSNQGNGPYITHVTTGKIVDWGIADANNMGSAMAPAAYQTLRAHFTDTGRTPKDYDLIVTGDLGVLGKEIVIDLFAMDGVDLLGRYDDCGVLIYDLEKQDMHCGGSGCGCSAAVLTGYLMHEMKAGRIKRLLFAATGALLSPTSTQQGESIPGICHAVAISTEREGA
ncbi:MAG: stage V sporulation protein AD [Oscillospiraceae bacterium]